MEDMDGKAAEFPFGIRQARRFRVDRGKRGFGLAVEFKVMHDGAAKHAIPAVSVPLQHETRARPPCSEVFFRTRTGTRSRRTATQMWFDALNIAHVHIRSMATVVLRAFLVLDTSIPFNGVRSRYHAVMLHGAKTLCENCRLLSAYLIDDRSRRLKATTDNHDATAITIRSEHRASQARMIACDCDHAGIRRSWLMLMR